MKKLLILCLLAMLSIPLIYAQCTDTDGGVTCNNQFYKDYCESPSTGGQYANIRICNNVTYQDCASLVGANRVLCPYGCKDGACIQITQKCTDSDGGKNYYVKGETSGYNPDTYSYYTAKDMCLLEKSDGNDLQESWCEENILRTGRYTCYYGCKDGACIQQTSICTDSDGGKNFYVKGYVSTNYNGQDPNNKFYDSCMLPDPNNPGQSYGVTSCSGESCSVEDFYCEGQQGPYGTFSKCPNGCKDGACIIYPTQIGCISSPVYNEDTCDGYRCVKNLNVNSACYSLDQCLSNRGDGTCVKSPAYKGDLCDGYRVMPGINEACYSYEQCESECLKTCSNENEFCGGIAGIQCCSGLTCELEGTYADASGKCVKTISKCTDSDGGKNYYIKGNVKGAWPGSTGDLAIDYETDGCCTNCYGKPPTLVDSSDTLVEVYCNEQNYIALDIYGCPNGCKDGACIANEGECFDSDSGKSYYIKGTVITSSETKTDSCTFCTGLCVPGQQCSSTCGGVVENYCEGGLAKSEEQVCPNNCEDGACLQSNHCVNGIQDSDEEGVDCGGSCDPCKIEVCNKNGACEIKQDENSENCPGDCYCGDDICDSLENYKDCPEDCRYCTPEWECHLEPATCPEEGLQNKVCIDTKCGTEDKRVEVLKCVPGTCSGCLTNEVCYPVTTRTLLDDIPNYCDVTKKFAEQKELGEQCQNNYECVTNECSDGECISIKKQLEETKSMLQTILDWIKNLF